MTTVSLCMIVRNEEKVLARCLDSVRGIADEICITDTGSTDKTREIARKYGTVQAFPWCDDFSAARNFSFAQARMDYTLWLDADDVLLSSDRQKLLALKAELDGTADVVMLPYFKTVREVETFIKAVDGRATTSLLLETREAAEQIDDIISVGGIDEIHIGLNDLSHSYGKKFLFEELADGTVDRLVERFKADGIKNYGFGGIASLGSGLLPAEMIIPEHYRLGSNCAILSRAFCDVSKVGDIDEIRRIFDEGVSAIRDYEKKCAAMSEQELSENSAALKQRVEEIVSNMQQ